MTEETFLPNKVIDIVSITPHPRNYKSHPEDQLGKLRASIARFDQVRSIVVQEGAPGKYLMVAGHGFVEAAKQEGKKRVKADIIPATWTPEQVEGYLIADNETGNDAEDDETALAQLLEEQKNAGYHLESLGYTEDQYQEFLDRLADEALTPDETSVPEVPKGLQPKPRQLPIDCIITFASKTGICCAGIKAGLKYGIQSNMAVDGNYCPYAIDLPTGRHKVVFVDNDYHEWDFALHKQVIEGLPNKPKYVTVRDLMTKQQCAQAGIDYFSLEEILDWAAELETLSDNVILIPKYDCLDKLPSQYVLGYSIPTSHGGTPLPVEAFKGRRVHLLGGSWKKQLAHMALLGEDVVALDNNYVGHIAQYGLFVDGDGKSHSLSELGPSLHRISNPLHVALTISYGCIAAKVKELYGGQVVSPEDDLVQEEDVAPVLFHDPLEEEDLEEVA